MGHSQSKRKTHLTSEGTPFTNSWDVLRAYESIRNRLPEVSINSTSTQLRDFSDVIDRYDVFLFDAFGVLNIGEHVIPGAVERVRQLQKLGKTVILVSNAASQPANVLIQKFQKLGFDFDASNTVFSRETLIKHWPLDHVKSVGIMANANTDFSDLPFEFVMLADNRKSYERADKFVFLSSAEWSRSRQSILSRSLMDRPRVTWVANPDLVAPRENGLSLEPGFFASTLNTEHALELTYFGKPYPAIFKIALEKANHHNCANKVLMVGDTLHTDVLGAKAMGFDAMLITGKGASKGLEFDLAFELTGINPDYLLEHI
jgi:glycerol-1-phosphatase